jgi:Clathrin adaptor complex small chain
MRVLTRAETYNATKENAFSLYQFCNDEKNDLLSKEAKSELKKWINGIIYKHHNESGFFQNFKDMFSINNESQVIEGQEDIAGIENNGLKIIVRQAEMGVNFSIIGNMQDMDLNKVGLLEEAVEVLDIGFNNARNLQSLMLFDDINNTLDDVSKKIQNKMKI